MAEAVVRGKVFPRNGYRNIEWDIKMFNSRGKIPRFALLWTKRDEMLEDDLAIAVALRPAHDAAVFVEHARERTCACA